MSIPSNVSYGLPRPAELPQGKVEWHPDPDRAVLLIHDMQRYFLGFYDSSKSPLPDLIRNVERLRSGCVSRSVPIVYTAQPSDPVQAARGLLTDVWGPGLTAHPDRASIVAELAPSDDDRVLQKTRYSAFQRTELLSVLRAGGRDQLWICGVYAHIGCLLTAAEAFMNDVKPFVVADAVADFSRAHHDMALDFVANRCGVVLGTDALCRGLEGASGPDPEARRILLEELSELGVDAEALADESALRDNGLDSVRLLDLAERLSARGWPVSFLDMMEHETLGSMASYVTRVASET